MNKRANILLGAVFAVVLLMAAATAVLASTQVRVEPDLATPEGTAQAYAVAVLEGDHQVVQSFLAPDSACEPAMYDYYVPGDGGPQLRLGNVTKQGDLVQVRIVVDESSSPFDSWTHEESIDLKQVDGTWVVQDTSWPLYGCM